MKRNYDFSEAKRGAILPQRPVPEGKKAITIRLDNDIIDHFFAEADASGGAVGYQTLINQALREYIEGKAPKLETMLRRVVREELRARGKAS
jgi:uncharacterized protein (DUF4415 family)